MISLKILKGSFLGEGGSHSRSYQQEKHTHRIFQFFFSFFYKYKYDLLFCFVIGGQKEISMIDLNKSDVISIIKDYINICIKYYEI